MNNNGKIDPENSIPADEIPIRVGDVIHHDVIGEGIVLSISNPTRRAIIEVDFGEKGIRKLMYRFAAIHIAETAQRELQYEEAQRARIRKIADRKPAECRKNAAEPAVSAASNTTSDIISICGYKFDFVQEIRPECDANGRVEEYYPELKPDKRLNRI